MTVSPLSTITTTLGVEKCPLTYSYYLKNIETSEWDLQATNIVPFTAFDSNTGDLTVFTSDIAFVKIYSIKWRIEDPDSDSEASFLEVSFDLNIVSICTTNTITSDGNGLDDKTYFLGDDTLVVSP